MEIHCTGWPVSPIVSFRVCMNMNSKSTPLGFNKISWSSSVWVEHWLRSGRSKKIYGRKKIWRKEKKRKKFWQNPMFPVSSPPPYYSLVLFSVAPSWPPWLQLGCLCLFSMSISNLFDLIIKHMGRLVKCVLRCAIIVISSIAIIITEKNLGVGVIVIQLYVGSVS